MKLKIVQEKLENNLRALAVLLDEPTFQISAEGIKIRAMDPSRVAMVDLELKKEAFDEFEVLGEENVTLNLSEFLKIVKRAGKEDMIELTFTELKKIKVDITGNYHRVFTLPSLESYLEETPLPQVAFKAEAKLTVGGFSAAIEDANMVSDHTYITIEDEKVSIHAVGDLNSADIELKEGDNVYLQTKATEKARACFSLSYLSAILKATKNAEVLTLSISTDMPLKLSIDTETPGKLDYYLAPRIETE